MNDRYPSRLATNPKSFVDTLDGAFDNICVHFFQTKFNPSFELGNAFSPPTLRIH
jgi:hypothetical protein